MKVKYLVTMSYCCGLLGTSKTYKTYSKALEMAQTYINYTKGREPNDCVAIYEITKKKSNLVFYWDGR